jgi:bifunctional non-homologous end joining protein LigD
VVVDEAGRPRFNALMFGRRAPVYVAFDVLYAHGENLRAMPLRARNEVLKKLLRRRHDLVVMEGIAGEGSRLFHKVCELDLEGIVAKRMSDPYPLETKWFKIPNRSYSQKIGRADLFKRS